MDPWHLSFQTMFFWYVGGYFGTLAASVVLRRLFWRFARPRLDPPLSVEEAAYFLDGESRLVEIAIARLLERGSVRVTPDGRLVPTGVGADHLFDRALLADIEHGYQRTHELPGLSGARFVGPVGQSVIHRNLFYRERWWQRWLVRLPVVLYMLAGTAHQLVGMVSYGWGGYVVLFLLFTLATLVARWFPLGAMERTIAGHKLYKHLTQTMPLTGAVGMVAVGGLAAYPNVAISVALVPPGVLHVQR